MATVTSKDGTQIAYDKAGQGETVILVDGALCFRAFGPMGGLAAQLSPHFTVINYDRRGRGESGDTTPYSVEREVEDIAALIDAAGGSAYIFGTSSGAALAMEATLRGLSIKKLAMYEPPYNGDPAATAASNAYAVQLNQALAEGRRGDAAGLFMSYVGMPPEALAGMKQAPVWPVFEAVAPTLAYDNQVMGVDCDVPTERASAVNVPTLLMTGGATFPFMHTSAHALADVIPGAQYKMLEGQTHEVDVAVLAPVLIEFFNS